MSQAEIAANIQAADKATLSIMNTIASYCGNGEKCIDTNCQQHYLVASYAVEGFVRLHSFSLPKTDLPPLYPTEKHV